MIFCYESRVLMPELIQDIGKMNYAIKDDTGTDMYSPQQMIGISKDLPRSIKMLITEIEFIRSLSAIRFMMNRLGPGIKVPPHQDWLVGRDGKRQDVPMIERWHMPVITNQDCRWWDETNGHVHMVAGVWHGPMPYWNYHVVQNNGLTERVHIVVDIETTSPVGMYTPWLPLERMKEALGEEADHV